MTPPNSPADVVEHADPGKPNKSDGGTSGVILLGRHAVGWLVASAAIVFLLLKDRTVFDWLLHFVGTLVIAGTITGLAALFFTRSQARKSFNNFVISAWVCLLLIALGSAGSNRIAVRSPETRVAQPDGPVASTRQGATEKTAAPSPAASARTGVERKAWSGNAFDRFESVEAITVRARSIPDAAEPRAWAAILAWQQHMMRHDSKPAGEALYDAVGTVLDSLASSGVCMPGRVVVVPAEQANEQLRAGTQLTEMNCDR